MKNAQAENHPAWKSQGYPRASSVRGRILGALLRQERLTSGEVWRRFGGSRLAADVDALERAGWIIERDDLNVTTSDGGRVATVRRYWLSGNSIGKAGDIGRAFGDWTQRIEFLRRAA